MKTPAESPKVKLFVYGTLKRGFPLNKHWMSTSEFLCTDTLYRHSLVSLGAYPALVALGELGVGAVAGEVWLMPADQFAKLRVMEESVGYITEVVTTADGHKCQAFVFAKLFTEAVEWEDHSYTEGKKFIPFGTVVPVDDVPF